MKDFMSGLKSLFSINGLIAALLTSLAVGYVLIGFDIIPDVIPFVGYFDDVVIVVLAFMAAGLITRKVMPGLGPHPKKR